MEQNNLQEIENKQKIKGELLLKLLLRVNIIFALVFIYNLINSLSLMQGLYGSFEDIFDFNRVEPISFLVVIIFIILLLLNFIPYFIAKNFYKKCKYNKQLLYGILSLILSQIIIFSFFIIAKQQQETYPKKDLIPPCTPTEINNMGADC